VDDVCGCSLISVITGGAVGLKMDSEAGRAPNGEVADVLAKPPVGGGADEFPKPVVDSLCTIMVRRA